ncbi:glycosyltransferase family 1 protein [Occultella gossypii]|uniref:Glycosyltransferase family 1 protein n=1 Tax=Occultella gossypii TaxID=2800820 RepID=A0ABS7S894_9MICO|nr:glycosyltransferase family 1 protein [Occultella gossypii]MBZ2196460.1 glycosyltransferase family 1 protein [Occultella gossypii]
MSRPSLLIIAFSPIHEDARVLKQVRLFTQTYDVTTVGYGPAPDGVAAHHEIPSHLVAWHKDRRALILRHYGAVQRTNAVIAHLRSVLPTGGHDVVLANDADTVPLALSLRPRAGVHVDLHEYAPRENEESWRWRLFVAPYYRWLCREYVARAASVTTVGQGLADEYLREFGIDATVVPNATPFHDLEPTPVHTPLRLVHSGNARRNRDLGLMIDAVRLTRADVTLDLYLMPNDPTYLAEIRAQAAGVPGVTVHDPVPYADLVRTLNDYDVGVFVLPPVTFNYEWTLPNKFFDYVQARVGIMVGPSPEMAALVREHSLGAVTEGFNPRSLADALEGLDERLIRDWKWASHGAASELSAGTQVSAWESALACLTRSVQ